MSKSVIAKVYWVPLEKGGRTALPAGKQYATVSCFQEDAESWPQEAWSIVLEFDEPPLKQGNPSMARARFLVDAAPVDRLKPGRAFDLYEGVKRVATVEIIE
ncbi:hypothetical protein [Candidatus Entotheonella palauensis]|uniref:Uncharacterized protein n=1 Tax=Candidatus Entotheonella gemina TaxID=1429439 RepID=W4L9L6_9BACT|nr:hypothetical protein [Candidatus Entotheonella palauensis]ETW94370.1 MAG: hypothetical protein ETSY2_49895 [Candidatus Entotheonella gemina]